ncbi:MAG: T9SS type A sorting domain-containing protein [Vicingus serpentipes]|nr:T9SS type A sorting domain-containing protein [Vicingus serpentipes]
MKTPLLTLFCLIIINSSSYAQCDFFEDYSTNSGWTQIGTEVEIGNGKLEFINGAADGSGSNGPQKRVYKSLGTTLDSSDTWVAEFEFKPITLGSYSGGFTGHNLLSITAGNQEPLWGCPDLSCTGYPLSQQDGITLTYETPSPTNGDQYFLIKARDLSTKYTSTTIIANALNTTYYLRLERISPTNIQLSVFSDVNKTTHINGSPINFTIPNTIVGLNTVQHGNLVGYDYRRELTGSIDNLCINFNPPALGIFSSTIEGSKLNIYPNPTSNQLTISGNYSFINKIDIYDITGKSIKSINQNTNTINVSDLPSRVYFVKIFDNEESIVKKFIKQ